MNEQALTSTKLLTGSAAETIKKKVPPRFLELFQRNQYIFLNLNLIQKAAEFEKQKGGVAVYFAESFAIIILLNIESSPLPVSSSPLPLAFVHMRCPL